MSGQFDVYRLPDGALVVDVQSPLVSVHGTRFVVPLIALDRTTPPITRLNPQLTVAGEPWVLATHFATTLDAKLLKDAVASLAADEWAIKGALDFLINGF